MAEFPALPLWTDAYIADTTHLSDAEHGRYLLMLMHLWRTPNKKFPNDDAWLARKFGRTEAEIRELFRPLLSEFFKSTGNWLYQARINREFSRVQAMSQRASARRSARHNAMKENANYSDSACSTAPVEQPEPEPEPERKNISIPSESHSSDDETSLAVEAYNDVARRKGLAICKKVTPDRRRKLKLRLKECGGICEWNKALELMVLSKWLMGENRRGWRVSIDFLLRPGRVARIVECTYADWEDKNDIRKNVKSQLFEEWFPEVASGTTTDKQDSGGGHSGKNKCNVVHIR